MEDYKKKYDELLLKLQKAKVDDNVCDEMYYRVIDDIVPELSESEDEKIRKTLIDFFNRGAENGAQTNGVYDKDILAWLEKKRKKVIPKNIDEAALQYVDTCPVNGEITHDNITEPYWNNRSMMNAYKAGWLEKQGEQDPYNGVSFKYNGHTWGMCARDNGVDILLDRQLIKHLEKQGEQIKPIFEVGDVMRTKEEATKGLKSGMPIVVYIDSQYYHCNNELIAIKDQYDYEYPPMNKKPVEWSEEDENLLKLSFENLTELKGMYGEDYGEVWKCINWLKSLKQRYTWKPSDEQMEALEHFVRSVGESGYAPPYDNNTKLLYSILSDLKKLKEE